MVVVSDASALINLAVIGHLEILHRLFDHVLIPQAVYDEILVAGAGQPGADAVAQQPWIESRHVANRSLVESLRFVLDLGEAEAIALAELTPEDAMDRAFREYDAALADEVLEAVKAMSPAHFERLIVELMLALGYGGTEDAGRRLGGTGDGGVDGVIDQDKLGLDKVYLQAKRWADNTVGRKEVQAFVGALSGMGATKGVFITSSSFSAQAEAYTRDNKSFSLSLVSGLELAKLMIQHDIGVVMRQRYELKRLDSDYFGEG